MLFDKKAGCQIETLNRYKNSKHEILERYERVKEKCLLGIQMRFSIYLLISEGIEQMI